MGKPYVAEFGVEIASVLEASEVGDGFVEARDDGAGV
jgi:hypothetical protein